MQKVTRVGPAPVATVLDTGLDATSRRRIRPEAQIGARAAFSRARSQAMSVSTAEVLPKDRGNQSMQVMDLWVDHGRPLLPVVLDLCSVEATSG